MDDLLADMPSTSNSAVLDPVSEQAAFQFLMQLFSEKFL